MNSKFVNHPAWNEMKDLFSHINAKSLGMTHLRNCECKIVGYYSEDDAYYKEIIFNYPLDVELQNFSMGETAYDSSHWLKMRYLLKVDRSVPGIHLDEDDDDQIGEFSLVFDANLNFVDEYWFIDVDSPFIIAKPGKE